MLPRLLGWRRRARHGQPSRTSQVVALTRASLDRPTTPDGDPDAQRRLCAGLHAPTGLQIRAHMAARTAFVDGQVLEAIGSGVTQIVVVGAGYDDRALRFRAAGVRFFELDQAGTQQDKARRVAKIAGGASQPTFVPLDLRHDDVAEQLARHGHLADRPTLFVCEGLLVYLDRGDILRLLAGLARRAPVGSTLAASLAIHIDGLDSAQVAEAANARRFDGATEPWRTILSRADHLALLAEGGWATAEAIDAPSVNPTSRAGSTLLVVAHPAGAPGP
jgi:methyltransferase (TIGR00027 family)